MYINVGLLVPLTLLSRRKTQHNISEPLHLKYYISIPFKGSHSHNTSNMQCSKTLSLFAALIGLSSAAPAAVSRQFAAQLTFTGAAASYTESVPANNTPFYTSKLPNIMFTNNQSA